MPRRSPTHQLPPLVLDGDGHLSRRFYRAGQRLQLPNPAASVPRNHPPFDAGTRILGESDVSLQWLGNPGAIKPAVVLCPKTRSGLKLLSRWQLWLTFGAWKAAILDCGYRSLHWDGQRLIQTESVRDVRESVMRFVRN